MKSICVLFFIAGAMSFMPNPLSSGNSGPWNEYKRSIIPGLGMDGDEAREIVEFKRSLNDRPQRKLSKLGMLLGVNKRDNRDQDYFYISD